MNENSEIDQDSNSDSFLSHWEKKCFEEWEKECLLEERISVENEKSSQRLWSSFQNSASAISHLYKEGGNHTVLSLWVPFQNAASNSTILYKDAVEIMKRSFDLGQQSGHHKRTRELLGWSKKRRRHVQREELIAFLCGKTAPLRHHRAIQNSMRGLVRLDSPRLSLTSSNVANHQENLQLFKDALALQNQGIPASSHTRRSTSSSPTRDDLCFIYDPLSSSRKRHNHDRNDSPNHKRQKISVMETDEY